MPVHHPAFIVQQVFGFECVENGFHRFRFQVQDNGQLLRVDLDNATRIVLGGGIEYADPHRHHQRHRLFGPASDYL